MVVGTTTLGAAVPATERQALMDLSNAMGAGSWTDNTDWLGAADARPRSSGAAILLLLLAGTAMLVASGRLIGGC